MKIKAHKHWLKTQLHYFHYLKPLKLWVRFSKKSVFLVVFVTFLQKCKIVTSFNSIVFMFSGTLSNGKHKHKNL